MHLSAERNNLLDQALNYNDLPKRQAETGTVTAAAAERECVVTIVQADHSNRFKTCFYSAGKIPSLDV